MTFVSENSPCSSSPCLNGGTCVIFKKTFFCSCTGGFLGDQCQSLYESAEDTEEISTTLVLVILGVVFVVIVAAIVLVSRAVAIAKRNAKNQDSESVHTASSTGFSSRASSSAWFAGYGASSLR